jgi:hypothetical protein
VPLRPRFPRRPVASAAILAALALVAGCPGGNRSIGEACSSVSDCQGGLQCLDHRCVPACARHTDCGDGYECVDGQCYVSSGALGSACAREVDCAPGLACHLDPTDIDGDGVLTATCQPDISGGVLGQACAADTDCRDGTCALGRCIDLCAADTDCPAEHVCSTIPRVVRDDTTGAESFLGSFLGCLPAHGTITYDLPVGAPLTDTFLPVPGNARSIALIMSVTDTTQLVGASRIAAPTGELLYQLPTTPEDRTAYYANPIRHEPLPGLSVLLLPQTPSLPLTPGAYQFSLGSFRADYTPASDIPRATVVAKLDTGSILDIHFYFVDLGDHPCAAALDGGDLDATSAKTSPSFQTAYLPQLRNIFARAGIALGTFTYDDVSDMHPDLEGLEAGNLGALLSLSTHEGGVSVFFVRTLSPAGMLALVGGTPGTPGMAGTAASGVVVSVDALCYRSWETMARVTAHGIARHLGLFRNKEPDGHEDPIPDSNDQPTNLMYYSEFGGTDLSDMQRTVLRSSPVLR